MISMAGTGAKQSGDGPSEGTCTRGKCIIVNMKTFADDRRKKLTSREPSPENPVGTDYDAINLERLFKQLGFETRRSKDNMSRKELIQRLEKCAEESHVQHDCFICIILSYGDEDNIFCHDDPVSLGELMKLFKPTPLNQDNCRDLATKPKMFFVQSCDRELARQPEGTVSKGPPSDKFKKIPVEANFLVAQCSLPGIWSWGNGTENENVTEKKRGSWFVQALCEVLDEQPDHQPMDLMKMLTRVNGKLAEKLDKHPGYKRLANDQIMCVTSTLIKPVLFKRQAPASKGPDASREATRHGMKETAI